jgi:hypothetical protein
MSMPDTGWISDPTSPGILGRRALPSGRLARLGATPDFHHGLPADSSVVVTFDLDFGDILALGGLDKPSVIICRLANERAESVNQRLAKVLAERVADLESGALVLIQDTRYRLRKLPVGRT